MIHRLFSWFRLKPEPVPSDNVIPLDLDRRRRALRKAHQRTSHLSAFEKMTKRLQQELAR